MSGSISSNTLSSIYKNSFNQYLNYSETIGGIIYEQSVCVNNVFKTTLEFINYLGKYKNPLIPVAAQFLTEPLYKEIEQVVNFEAKASDHIFQITLISKSIKIFEWTKENEVDKFVSNRSKYVQFYQQKAQSEIEGMGRTHFEWLKYWNETYEEFSIFIVNFFKNGVVWSGNIHFPLNHVLGDSNLAHEENHALLSDINKAENIQSILHHYPTLPKNPTELVQVFKKQDDKWLIQNQKDNHKDLILNTAKKEDRICIYNCEDCTIVVENLVDTIRLDICKRVVLLFRNASKVGASDCKDCRFHCFEKIDTVEFISCEICGIYLPDKSLNSSIVTTKCSGINVNFPFDDGLYQTFKISDQLKTRIVPNKGIESSINE